MQFDRHAFAHIVSQRNIMPSILEHSFPYIEIGMSFWDIKGYE